MIEILAQEIRYTPGRHMPPHVDGCRRLSILTRGALTESDLVRAERAGVGSVVLKAPDVVHDTSFGESGTTIVSAILPDTVVSRLGFDARGIAPWRWHHDGTASLVALRLAYALKQADGPGAGACLEALLAGFAAAPVRRADEAPEPLRRLARALERVPSEPVAATRAAKTARLHPSSLSRSFRRHFGCSMSRYRQRARVLAVARTLLGTGGALTHIALDHGFADVSHMTRLFRRELGAPPGRFRRVLTASPCGAPPRRDWAVNARATRRARGQRTRRRPCGTNVASSSGRCYHWRIMSF